jgi:hypothetical protein
MILPSGRAHVKETADGLFDLNERLFVLNEKEHIVLRRKKNTDTSDRPTINMEIPTAKYGKTTKIWKKYFSIFMVGLVRTC